ncbi:FixH family protein [Oceanomicrobium pacificus]|uniref:Nitrogen fixation protein FixH n=1 Tax=Oceanomicrobium pacificus TaxID=2692916 RepID=A0A6B0TNX7_9RHOB|nr:FixH family protein [Oceanomicrobium pacificus]MXU65576.1 nitrogen fixation protein FixH [Oceanomicrobium pacificus]
MSATEKPLTGRKVLMICVAAFGIIIAANMAMLFAAVGSFPGLETPNSYVASQKFEAKSSRQAALGWRFDLAYENGEVLLDARDRDGQVLDLAVVEGTLGRMTHQRDDQPLVLTRRGDLFVAPADLNGGKWRLDVTLPMPGTDGTAEIDRYDTRLELFVARAG